MTAISTSSTARSRRRVRVSTAATVGAAYLTIWSAIIHLDLWTQGYRHIPDIGRLFLAQGVAGVVIGGAAIAWRRTITALAGAAYLAATSAGLLLSATVGVFHFHDGLDAPYAALSLVVQGSGLALFGFAALLHGPVPRVVRRRDIGAAESAGSQPSTDRGSTSASSSSAATAGARKVA